MISNYYPANDRYEKMIYRRCGKSGLKLPLISLGLWHNFGESNSHSIKRDMCCTAFDNGITHFDLANNYGPPAGSAEQAFGKILREDFKNYRDEIIISTKAGYDMCEGPYGEWGSRKYMLSSLDQSLKRLGIDYVDIFYSHRFDPETPLEETMGALAQTVNSGKALYVGISSYNREKTIESYEILKKMGIPLLIHQPSYSLLNRWIESDNLLSSLNDIGSGCIAFSPLAQGMLTDKYLNGIPKNSRATQKDTELSQSFLNQKNLNNINNLNQIAKKRGQTLAQMSLSWVLRKNDNENCVTTALIGARFPEQISDCLGCLNNLDFSKDELREIDLYAVESGINVWSDSSEYA